MQNLREDLLGHYNKWNSIVDRVVDLFMRVDLGQAEIRCYGTFFC